MKRSRKNGSLNWDSSWAPSARGCSPRKTGGSSSQRQMKGSAYPCTSWNGQAIFLIQEDVGPGVGEVTIPYEFLPLPQAGDTGTALGRDGRPVCTATVVKVRSSPAFDHTNLLTIKVPNDMLMKVRFYQTQKGGLGL